MRKFKRIITFIIMIVMTISLVSCENNNLNSMDYEGRTFYEIFVRAFNDSNGDGIGDIKGVTQKLDYLQELGIKGIWLMPVTKSTSYHGYDTEDYYLIDEDYGDIDDLKELIDEAHKRDIKVIMDLVLNHTSTEHPWFKEASQDKNSQYRDYYIWTEDMSKIDEISDMDTKRWAKNGDKNELYNAIFWEGMPDLNMDNPKVIQETKDIAKYYLELGIDGFRLDAVKWIYEDKEKNIAFWQQFHDYVKSVNENAVLVGEVWDKPAAITDYAEPLDSFFEFEIGKVIMDGIQNRLIASIPEKFNSWNDNYLSKNENFVISNFLSNHDQSRVMNRLRETDKAKMAAAIYLTLPGTPYIYYGEEIGMRGSKPDEKIREPFIWSSTDKSLNTSWIEITNDINSVALDVQKDDKDSIYNFYKDIIKVKNENEALKYGKVNAIDVGNRAVLVMERTYNKDRALVIINSSSKEENITLDKKGYKVLYSNGNNKGIEKLSSEVSLKSGEVIIVK